MASSSRTTRNKAALTHRGIEGLRPSDVAYRVPDALRPGLAVRVAASGVKTWDLAFRIRGIGPKRISLGEFPFVSLENARVRATELINAAKIGKDLIAEERAAKAKAASRTTVAELIELYLARKVRGRLRTGPEIEIRLKRVLEPLKTRYADEIHRRDLRALLDATAERGVLREAEKQRQLFNVMFRWGLSQDIVETDPAAGLASYGSSPRRNRVLSGEEIKIFWNWLDQSGLPLDYAAVLRLQLAIGARVGEVGRRTLPGTARRTINHRENTRVNSTEWKLQ